jgi:hypothetical protein
MPTKRRERNQQLFREVNKRIREVSTSFDLTGPDSADFVCERGNTNCTEQITIALNEYARVSRSGGYFLVLPGHERSGQRIVRRTDQYVVVEELATIPAPTGT